MTNKDRSPAPTQATKRTRFEDDAIKPSKRTAPTQAAASMVEAAVGTCPHAIQIILKAASKNYNSLKATIRNTQHIIERFDDDTEIPGSAKLNFKLTAPPEVIKLDEDLLLAAAMDQATKDFQSKAKASIVASPTCDLNMIKDTLNCPLSPPSNICVNWLSLRRNRTRKIRPSCNSHGGSPTRWMRYSSSIHAPGKLKFKTN